MLVEWTAFDLRNVYGSPVLEVDRACTIAWSACPNERRKRMANARIVQGEAEADAMVDWLQVISVRTNTRKR